MAPRKQTRRCVSLRPASYDKVKTYCDARGVSMSSFIEDRWAEFCVGVQRHANDDDVPPVPEEPPEPPPERFEVSGVTKDKPKPYEKPPIRGGGVHEL